jgi:diguanylate cyclase (GGDEF)-like protein
LKPFWSLISRYIGIRTQFINKQQICRLFMPSGRSAYTRRYAASLIIARVRLISAFFALIVPLWSIVDFLTFDTLISQRLTLLRLVAAAAFVLLAWPRRLSDTRPYAQAIVMLLAMMMVPSVFYLTSLMTLNPVDAVGMQAIMINFYVFMPTIVLAGLAIFPLTALEIILLSLPVLATTSLGFFLDGTSMLAGENIIVLWCMLMMTGVAIFSGMSQSHYMDSMIRRATTDPLTGASSRSSGMETLERLFHLSAISRQPLSIAFLDVDNFKSINDNFGHEAGDQMLRQITRHLRGLLRNSDILVRWGGEEFIVILPNMPSSQLSVFLNRMGIGALGLRPDGKALTASVGIAETLTDKVGSWRTLVELADRRMYEAKRQGRARAILPENIMVRLDLAPAEGQGQTSFQVNNGTARCHCRDKGTRPQAPAALLPRREPVALWSRR